MTYTDNSGIQHESYTAACEYYGCDTPAQIAAELAYEAAQYSEELMDRMMAGEVQPDAFAGVCHFDDIPF